MGRELFLAKSKKISWFLKYLKPLSVIGAVAYAFISPAESTINGEHSLVFSIVIALLIQIPLCSVILYFILKSILRAPLGAIKKEVEKNPDTHWGLRTFFISNTGISLKAPDTEFTVAPERIKGITETENFIALTDGESPLFILPKSVFTVRELRQAFTQINTEQD